MKKKEKVWGNGVGLSPVLWFSRPREFVLRTTRGTMGSVFKEYVPKGDNKSSFFNGGFWALPRMGITQAGDCIVCLSKNRKEVQKFMKVATRILNFGCYWQRGFN